MSKNCIDGEKIGSYFVKRSKAKTNLIRFKVNNAYSALTFIMLLKVYLYVTKRININFDTFKYNLKLYYLRNNLHF